MTLKTKQAAAPPERSSSVVKLLPVRCRRRKKIDGTLFYITLRRFRVTKHQSLPGCILDFQLGRL